MKKVLLWMGKALFAGIIAVFVLSLFCMVYSYEGIHITEETGATDYSWESHQWKATMNEGFAWINMDENGYNNAHDYSEEVDILLMGSSHMEALQVDTDENTGYLLNQLLPEYKTYNIGISGHTIYRCIDNLDAALETYLPKNYVVLVVDTVDLNEEDMKSVLDGTAKAIPSYDSGIMYYLQKIPAVKAVYKQLSEWISLDEAWADEGYRDVLTQFLTKASEAADKAKCELIIVYQPQQTLTISGDVDYNCSEEDLESFKKTCEKVGVSFIDMTEDFEQLYEEEHKLAHGFANSELGEGHLNKYGHSVIAKAIAERINELEGNDNDN